MAGYAGGRDRVPGCLGGRSSSHQVLSGAEGSEGSPDVDTLLAMLLQKGSLDRGTEIARKRSR